MDPRREEARPREATATGPDGYDELRNHHTAPRIASHGAGVLLSRLLKVRSMGNDRWIACCPAHLDKSPSLSIREVGDRVLLHCFAGCDPADVIAAVGLEWRDLSPDRDRWHAARTAGVNEHAHEYRKASLRRELRDGIDIGFERRLLARAAAELRGGAQYSLEDRARIEVAMERVAASEGRNHG